MPRGQPFTALCQQAAQLGRPVAADLHAHTTRSDGDFSPSQLVAFARKARLEALAVTDHDTMAAVPEAVEAASGSSLEVVAGAEASVAFEGAEYHLLGLFVRDDHRPLRELLRLACMSRRERFRRLVVRLKADGVTFPDGMADAVNAGTVSVGRRHLAGLLVQVGAARSRYDAFQRFVIPASIDVPPIHLIPAADAIQAIREAGGVAALAHPRPGVDESRLAAFRDLGMAAVEVHHPAAGPGHVDRLRGFARRLGLAVTGGSDCHGPTTAAARAVGGRGLTRDEFRTLKRLAGSAG